MSTEQALREVLESDRSEAFRAQIHSFREFQQRLARGGYQIQMETFSIPLMERVAPCIHKK